MHLEVIINEAIKQSAEKQFKIERIKGGGAAENIRIIDQCCEGISGWNKEKSSPHSHVNYNDW